MHSIFFSVSCGAPTTPANSHITNYSSSIEGSKVTFHCDVNSATVTATCSGNKSWIPDPATLDCKLLTINNHNALYIAVLYRAGGKVRVERELATFDLTPVV